MSVDVAFCISEALTLAFNTKLIGQSAKAAVVNRSQRQSQRIQRSVAQAFLRCQHKLFWFIIHKCMTSESLQQPLLAVDTLLSDETKQRLKMSLVATGSTRLPGQCMQAPHVFVSERSLTLYLADGQARHMPYVTLPVPMISTSAGPCAVYFWHWAGLALTLSLHMASSDFNYEYTQK